MGYYSFVAFARHSVVVSKPQVALGRGLNTFTAVVGDVERFKERLADAGVDIRETHRLDGLEPLPPESIFLSPEGGMAQLGEANEVEKKDS